MENLPDSEEPKKRRETDDGIDSTGAQSVMICLFLLYITVTYLL